MEKEKGEALGLSLFFFFWWPGNRRTAGSWWRKPGATLAQGLTSHGAALKSRNCARGESNPPKWDGGSPPEPTRPQRGGCWDSLLYGKTLKKLGFLVRVLSGTDLVETATQEVIRTWLWTWKPGYHCLNKVFLQIALFWFTYPSEFYKPSGW